MNLRRGAGKLPAKARHLRVTAAGPRQRSGHLPSVSRASPAGGSRPQAL